MEHPPKEINESDPTSEPNSPTKKKMSLTIEDFTVKHRLGKGAYGDVFYVIKNSDKNEYAMKQIQKKKLQREQKEYQAMVQKELLSVMTHSNIVKLKYAFQDKISLYFIFELCQGGQFIEFIKLNINKLTQEIRIFYIAQMINILYYLHSNGITHRDIKPENLMLDKKGHLVLIDFGTAEITNCKLLSEKFKEHILSLKKKSDQLVELNDLQQVEDQNGEDQKPKKKKIRRSTFVGSHYYISPELLQFNYCPPSADLWALGCIIYQLYYLQTPFKDNSEFVVFEKIKKCQVDFPKHDNITPEAIDLIKRLLVKDPDMRLGSDKTQQFSYAKLKAHPYFKGIDIDNIFNKSVPFITDLQQPQKNDKLKKQAQIKHARLQQMQESFIKDIQQKGKIIIKSSIIKQKSFLFYNEVLLIICKQGYIFLISPEQNYEIQEIIIEKDMSDAIRLISNSKLEIKTKQKTYHFLSNQSEDIMKILSAQI